MRLVMDSMKKRESNETFFAFTNIPRNKKEIQHMFLNSKHSIMKNILSPKVQYGNELAMISPTELVKNTLMIGIDVASVQVRGVEKNIEKYINNSIADSVGVKKEIRELAKKHNETDEDMHVIPCVEFRDRFNPYSSITSNEGFYFIV